MNTVDFFIDRNELFEFKKFLKVNKIKHEPFMKVGNKYLIRAREGHDMLPFLMLKFDVTMRGPF